MIGQIIYNVEDYAGSGGLISTKKNNINEIVCSLDNNYEEEKINIYNNIFDQQNLSGYSSISKLGIQAPPGTKFYLNKPDEKASFSSFIIGRTGIYELDDGVPVNNLSFEKPKKYTIDTEESTRYVNEGISQMEQAKYKFDEAYKALRLQFESATSSMSNDDFWEEYDLLHSAYVKEYTTARVKYLKGLSGIYVENPFAQDLRNIIIDFKTEGSMN